MYKLYDDIIKVIRVFSTNLDFDYLSKLINSFKLNNKFYFVIYDLVENQFLYSNPSKDKLFGDTPSEFFNRDYQYLKKICHPLDFANLIKEIVTLIYYADYTNSNIIKSESEGQVLRIKNKNGEWIRRNIHLIYFKDYRKRMFKFLLCFIEDDTIIEKESTNITSREKEIFKLLSSGYSAKMIANKLNISETTVITHRKNLIHKLHARNSAELIKKGFELNLTS